MKLRSRQVEVEVERVEASGDRHVGGGIISCNEGDYIIRWPDGRVTVECSLDSFEDGDEGQRILPDHQPAPGLTLTRSAPVSEAKPRRGRPPKSKPSGKLKGR